MTHQPDTYLIGPLQGDDQSLAAHATHRYGLDQVVFTIPAIDAKAVASVVGTVASAVSGPVGAVSALFSFFGVHLGAIADGPVVQITGKVDILLSDLLILMGAGVFFGPAVASFIPKP